MTLLDWIKSKLRKGKLKPQYAMIGPAHAPPLDAVLVFDQNAERLLNYGEKTGLVSALLSYDGQHYFFRANGCPPAALAPMFTWALEYVKSCGEVAPQ